MTDWKPIETAPRDTVILVCRLDEDGDSEIITAARHLSHYIGTGHSEWMAEADAEAYLRRKPTHWMSLPKPPVIQP